jgi:hypothetical protein
MNMKKNGFCKESTGKGKAYDTKIHVKHAQIKPNEISDSKEIYGNLSILTNGIFRVSLS